MWYAPVNEMIVNEMIVNGMIVNEMIVNVNVNVNVMIGSGCEVAIFDTVIAIEIRVKKCISCSRDTSAVATTESAMAHTTNPLTHNVT